MAKLSPIESEFESTEEAEAYDLWFRAKVAESLASTEPSMPHDMAMAELDRRLQVRRDAAADLAA